MALETFLYKRNLELYQTRNKPKIDIHFARVLAETVETISKFLSRAEIQDQDENFNINNMIPSFEAEMCQGHRYYFCRPCNRNVKASSQSFHEHFSSAKHLKNLTKHERSVGIEENVDKRSKTTSESEKPTEKSKSREKRERPLKQTRKQSIMSFGSAKKFRLFLNNVKLDSYIANLEKEGEIIKQSNVHKSVCDLLKNQLSPLFPKMSTYPFGSIVNGLARNGGDLDIYIDLNDCYNKKPNRKLMKTAIFQMKNMMMQHANDWTGFCPITKARTPILKATCKSLRIQCDFSFSNGLSHCNTQLIGYFLDVQPVTKKIVLFVKSWVNEFDLGMNSYIVTMLVIFHLQQKELLPSVEQLLAKSSKVEIDGWICSTFTANDHPLEMFNMKKDETPILDHLIDFFKFYGESFDFKKHIISLLAGRPIEKKIFDHGREDEIPDVFETFKVYMQNVDWDCADEIDDLFANEKPLVIQDPFELCHNVGKGVREKGLKRIVECMKMTHTILLEFTNTKLEEQKET